MLPRSLCITLIYRTIEELIALIDQPHREQCLRVLHENRALFETAQGSTHNHQAWHGGYIDHITDGMNLANHLYTFMNAFGRPLPFSRSDALLIFFLHDLEKPWRIQIREGIAQNAPGLETKEAFKAFREAKLVEYGITLTPYQMNALTYVEGEYKDYTSKRRVMNKLAAFCHLVDTWCARGWYDYPMEQNDEWIGAHRVRTSV
jgi:hypothetical protein